MIPQTSRKSSQRRRLRISGVRSSDSSAPTCSPSSASSSTAVTGGSYPANNSSDTPSSSSPGSSNLSASDNATKNKAKKPRLAEPNLKTGNIWELNSVPPRNQLIDSEDADNTRYSNSSHSMIGAGKSSHGRRHQRAGTNGFQTNSSASRKEDGNTDNQSGSKRNAPKKLNVQIAKPAPTLQEGFEERAWQKLKDTLENIYAERSVSYSRQELSQEIEDLCIHNKGKFIYDKLAAMCRDHMKSLVSSVNTETTDSTTFLSQVRDIWEKHNRELIAIRAIFIYLDRTFVAHCPETDAKSIWGMGVKFFKEELLSSGNKEEKTVNSFLDLVRKERQGQMINRALLKDISKMFSMLEIYGKELEEPLVEQSEHFFRTEAQQKVEQFQKEEEPHTEVADFLQLIESRLHEEMDRVRSCLEHKTQLKLVEIVERLMIQNHVDPIVDHGFKGLMDNDMYSDITRMHRLLEKAGEDAMKKLKQAWVDNIKKSVGKIIQEDKENRESSKQIIPTLLTFKDKCDKIWIDCLSKKDLFGYGMKSAFEHVVNGRANRSAELLAKFVDSKLRSGNKQETEEEVDHILDRVIVLFRYIHGKDVFEAFYKKDLAKRLLLRRCASTELEKTFLQKLKTECGAAFTAKLEGMFKDMDHSEDLMRQWASQRSLEERGGVEANVHVLTSSHWPSYPAMEALILPSVLKKCTDAFEEFYLSKFSNNRRLYWQHSLEHVTLRAFFPHGKKELEVSLFQALVLLLYNNSRVIENGDKLDFKTIKSDTGMEDAELRRTLQSLACGRVKVLTKESKGKDVQEDDVFAFNKEFKAKLIRLKINTVQVKETKEEQKETNERVYREREHMIDAAVVRIMKSRQTITHRELMSETMHALSSLFSAESSAIKKRIESLIERDYMERDEEDSSTYHYVA
eukprot:gb/GECG01006175.1/.p1 GENE.gb/GECG01006175.1/~~gb/GECG01006175.1/.p1  ORF type:complete len:910 (+),score=149.26 gb/GECG01006175.1/:1-2730(+)